MEGEIRKYEIYEELLHTQGSNIEEAYENLVEGSNRIITTVHSDSGRQVHFMEVNPTLTPDATALQEELQTIIHEH